jgi:hypothetical protein
MGALMGRARFMYDNFITDESMLTVTSLYDGLVTSALKDGTGSAVITTSGTFTNAIDLEYVVEIDSVAGGAGVGQATFKWSDDGGATWDATGVTTSATDITLNNGVNVKWTAGSGDDFIVGDKWYFKGINRFNAGKMIDLNRDSRYRSALEEVLLADDCSSLGDWSSLDWDGGETTQVTFGGKSCYRLDPGPAPYAMAGIRRDVGSYGSFTEVNISLYHVAIGTYFGGGYAIMEMHNGTANCWMIFGSDGLRVWDGSNWNVVGADIVAIGEWQDWRFVIDWASHTMDVYLGEILQASDVECYLGSSQDGVFSFSQSAGGAGDSVTYVDNIKIANLYSDDSDHPSYSTIIIDLGAEKEIKALILGDHNISSGATITLKGHTSDSWGSPDFSENVTFAADKILHYLSAATSKRYWKIEIYDPNNTDGYIEIGELYLGTYLELSKNFAAGFSEETNFIVETNTSPYGIDRDRFYNTQKIFNIDFNVVPAEDVASMEAMVSAITDRAAGIIKPVWFNKDSDSPEKTWLVKLSSLPVEHVTLSFYDMLIELREVLRSV